MPFFHVISNMEMDSGVRSRIKEEFGRIVEDIPGKSERWLMVGFTAGKDNLYFQGSSEPCALVDVSVYGHIPEASYDPLTKDITDAVSREAGISKNRIYVKYSETQHWGLGGENF